MKEISNGVLSDNGEQLIKMMATRPPPDPLHSTYIMAQNLEVDLHNAEQLQRIPKDVRLWEYKSKDTGSIHKLDQSKRIAVSSLLKLKVVSIFVVISMLQTNTL